MFKQDWLSALGMAAIGIVCLGFGFFLGVKSINTPPAEQLSADSAELSKISEYKKAGQESKIIEREVPEVHFFQLDEAKTCPAEYPIKAKFGTDAPIFYTTENKFFDRVSPHICFSSEAAALKNGFIEKK